MKFAKSYLLAIVSLLATLAILPAMWFGLSQSSVELSVGLALTLLAIAVLCFIQAEKNLI
jgi:hypothetical protein